MHENGWRAPRVCLARRCLGVPSPPSAPHQNGPVAVAPRTWLRSSSPPKTATIGPQRSGAAAFALVDTHMCTCYQGRAHAACSRMESDAAPTCRGAHMVGVSTCAHAVHDIKRSRPRFCGAVEN